MHSLGAPCAAAFSTESPGQSYAPSHNPKMGKTAVVYCVGRIVAGEIETLRKVVLSQASRQTVALDLTRADAIDGSGLGLLVFLQGWARTVGIDLQLMNPTQHVRELLELTNLGSVFKILSSEETARKQRFAVPATDTTAAYQSD